MTHLTTPRFGLDAAGPIPVTAQKAIGSTFNIRYLSRYTWKILQPGEYVRLHAAGIDLGLVFEDEAARPRRGYEVGKADALFCKQQAAARGVPGFPFPVFWAYDAESSGYVSILEPYAEGFASVFGKGLSGPYGDYSVVKHFSALGYITWQTYGWSGGRFCEQTDVYQYSNGHNVGGADTDYNHLYDDRVLVGASKPKPPLQETSVTTAYTLGNVLTVIAANDSGDLYQLWQKGPGTDWSHGNPAEGTFSYLAEGKGPVKSLSSSVNGGVAEVIVELKNGKFYHAWQHESDRSWSGGETGVRIAAMVPLAPALP